MQGYRQTAVQGPETRARKSRTAFRRGDLRCAALLLLLGVGLSGCASDALDPSEGMARIVGYEGEKTYNSSSRSPDYIGQPLGMLPGIGLAWSVGRAIYEEGDGGEPRYVETAYVENVFVYKVDGKPVVPARDGIEVAPGEHRLSVQYCRIEADEKTCSAELPLIFVAEADTRYELVRQNDLDILLLEDKAKGPWIVGRTGVKAGTSKDEERCLRARLRKINEDEYWARIEAEEAEARREKAKSNCHEFAFGDLEPREK